MPAGLVDYWEGVCMSERMQGLGAHHLQVDVSRCDDDLDVGWHFTIVQLLHQLLHLRCGLIALPVAAHEEASLADHGCDLPCAESTDTIQGVADLYHKSQVQLLQHAAHLESGSWPVPDSLMMLMRPAEFSPKLTV
jgi:hypothetical protein